MILVVGASGFLGGLIARSLLERGEQVRALDRGSGASDGLAEAGAELVPGDLKDPESLRAACDGVDAVVTTANSAMRGGVDTVESVDRQGNAALVDAAVSAGVTRFVLTSMLGASPDSPAPFVRAKAEAEQHLRESSLAWTVLQPNAFMDVWFPAVLGPALAGQPVTLVGEGRRRHSFVAVRDVAAHAVSVLTGGSAERETLAIGGPEALSWSDVVGVLEEEVGHPVEVRHVAPGDEVPHLPPSMVGMLAGMDMYDSPVDMTALGTRHGVEPTPAAAVVRGLVVSGGPR
jgi:uncharacterized protein YbjT (DUF2867 family)